MGWSGGSILVRAIINSAMTHIKNDVERKEFYKKILPAFMNEDWDTWNEATNIDEAFDSAFLKLYPNHAEEASLFLNMD